MQTAKAKNITGFSAILVSLVCWGTVPVFMHYLSDFMNSWTMNMYRYLIAAIIYIPVIAWFIHKGQVKPRLLIACLIPTIVNVMGQILWAEAPFHLTPGIMSIFIKTSLIWSTAASFILFKDERILLRRAGFWIGIAITAVSITMFSLNQSGISPAASGITAKGLILILICALFWGMYPVSVKKLLADTDPRLAFGLICINSAFILTVIGCIKGDPGIIASLPPKVIIILIVSAVIGIAFSHISYYYALKTIGVIVSTNITMLTPVITLLLSFLMRDEPITFVKIVLGAGILTGVFIITWARQNSIITNHTTQSE